MKKLTIIFVLALFLTLIAVRFGSYALHDKQNYGTLKERSKTITYVLRHNTGLDIHHIHIGIVILIITTGLIFLGFVNPASIIILSISISLIMDQILPLIFGWNYFSPLMLLSSILLNIIVAECALIYSLFR